jgi:DNA polymerase-3 subunit alpha
MPFKENDFVHLHLHTSYSLLDGAIRIPYLMEKLKQQGVKAVAITDHGAMYGIVDFYKQCQKNDIKPIIGCEVYVAPGEHENARFDREYSKEDDKNYHLVLLAKNNTGLKNLQILVSKGFLEGFYYKPRIDKTILKEFSEGLIGLSACIGGEPAKNIIKNDYKKAREVALWYEEVLGKGNYYLEIQKNTISEQQIVNQQLINISKETGIPLVATNDCHYLNEGDHVSHQILMNIQMQSTINSKNKWEMHADSLYVKSPEEMREAFKDLPEACDNTIEIARKCNVTIEFGNMHFPVYDVPEGYTIDSYFEHIAREGLRKKLANIPAEKHKEYYDRLQFELDIIINKHYAGYFLVVWDFINYSKTKGIPVGPGRGSGAGSLVAYSMGITDLDPIPLKLLFERFLNPERESMPDFDIDFCIRGRDKVIEYVREKYGKDKVSMIITYGKLLARGVVRDVGRVLEIPLPDVDKIAKEIPNTPGLTLEKAFKKDKDLRKRLESMPGGKEILEHALKLEGLIKSAGVHAAGVVIGDKPLVEYVPLSRDKEGEVVAQFEKDTLESVGLIKFDFLGLKNLTIIDEAVKRIRKNTDDKEFQIEKIPLDDKKTYELLSRGDTTGVFQLESAGMKNLLKKLKPNKFEDVIALVALYRPGPIGSGMLDDFVMRKHGEQKITYDLPELEEVLKDTYGIIVYQEQVMQIAQVVAGYSLGNADLLRRAMGKKKPEVMREQKEYFINGSEKLNIPGAIKKGFDPKIALEIFNLMEKFAEYGFNKSHSAAYALIAYQTAYLKANYPMEYMAAILSCESDPDKIVIFSEECKAMGIKVIPPSVNLSMKDFRIVDDAIVYGLKAIKNVGEGAIDSIIEAREKDGEFKNIYEYCKRVDLRQANKKVLEALIKSGAMDCFGNTRSQLMAVVERAIDAGQKEQKMKQQGVIGIEAFLKEVDEDYAKDEYSYPDIEEWPEHELLKLEKEMLGFYVSSHPLASYSQLLEIFTTPSNEFKTLQDATEVTIGGIVKNVKNHMTKAGKRMAFVTLEDLYGEIEVVLFPRVFERNIRFLEEDRIILIKGKFSDSNDKQSVLADEIYDINDAMDKMVSSVVIKLNMVGFTEERLMELKRILLEFSGNAPVFLEIKKPTKYKVNISLSEGYKVRPCYSLFKQLDSFLGENMYELKIA